MISALGLDIGQKRIGVAGCDGTGLIATGLTTIERRSFDQDVAQIRHWIAVRQVQILVVGLPYTLDGKLGFQAQRVQKLAERLGQVLNLPLEYIDERLTSWQAKQLIQAQGSTPTCKGVVDRKAAAIILQQWLDQRRLARALPQTSFDKNHDHGCADCNLD